MSAFANIRRFAAMCYGRPCTIQEVDWDVSVIFNLDDTSTRCPGFDSTEILEVRNPTGRRTSRLRLRKNDRVQS